MSTRTEHEGRLLVNAMSSDVEQLIAIHSELLRTGDRERAADKVLALGFTDVEFADDKFDTNQIAAAILNMAVEYVHVVLENNRQIFDFDDLTAIEGVLDQLEHNMVKLMKNMLTDQIQLAGDNVFLVAGLNAQLEVLAEKYPESYNAV